MIIINDNDNIKNNNKDKNNNYDYKYSYDENKRMIKMLEKIFENKERADVLNKNNNNNHIIILNAISLILKI